MVPKDFKKLFSKINFQREIPRVWSVATLLVLATIFSTAVYQKRAAQMCPSIKKCATSAPLAPGKQTYTVLTNSSKGPQVLTVDFDPLDVKVGEEQIITVKVEDSESDTITSKNTVTATYHTDAETEPATISLELKQVEGPPQVTTWAGAWTPEYTHNCIYSVTIEARSDAGQSSVDLSFR